VFTSPPLVSIVSQTNPILILVVFTVGRPEGKRPLGKPRCRWEDNIKMDLRDIGIDGANWIQLAQDRVQWRAFVNTVMNLRVPKESRISLTS
jgi:hypothetical protein